MNTYEPTKDPQSHSLFLDPPELILKFLWLVELNCCPLLIKIFSQLKKKNNCALPSQFKIFVFLLMHQQTFKSLPEYSPWLQKLFRTERLVICRKVIRQILLHLLARNRLFFLLSPCELQLSLALFTSWEEMQTQHGLLCADHKLTMIRGMWYFFLKLKDFT